MNEEILTSNPTETNEGMNGGSNVPTVSNNGKVVAIVAIAGAATAGLAALIYFGTKALKKRKAAKNTSEVVVNTDSEAN